MDSFELFLWEMKIDLPDLVDDLVDDDGGQELLQLIVNDFEEWLKARTTVHLTVPCPLFARPRRLPVAEIRLGENGESNVSFVEDGAETSSNTSVEAEFHVEEDPPVAEIKVEVC